LIKDLLAFLYALSSLLLIPYSFNCFYLMFKARKHREKQAGSLMNHPKVTVQLPVYNERYVVTRLIKAVSALQYPKDRLQILVLDDSTDDTTQLAEREVERLRGEGVDIQLVHRSNREGFKAGALQNALRYTTGKYVVVFDADFVPRADFLEKTIPHLEEDPSLGFVQTRWGHLNREYSKFTEAFALGMDVHFMVDQAGRSEGSLLMNFNGSGGVLRTEAIRDSGGWNSDTLTEDLDLSYRIQMKGWKALYLKDIVVPGEVPVNMPSFKSQQARWACGSIQCARKLLGDVWRSNLFSFLQKLQATMHMTYYIIHPLMVILLIVTVPMLALNAFPFKNLFLPFAILFGLCAVSTSTTYMSSIQWQNLSLMRKFPYMFFLSVIGGGLSAECSLSVFKGLLTKGGFFARTPKYNILKRRGDWTSKVYKPLEGVPIFEVLLAAYALIGAALVSVNELWGLCLLLYFIGYATVAYYTRKHYKHSASCESLIDHPFSAPL
jgi:cellulose synthase/poly-beta-1,6-N-acetylglucosamine synthase-like glycosyltransferase